MSDLESLTLVVVAALLTSIGSVCSQENAPKSTHDLRFLRIPENATDILRPLIGRRGTFYMVDGKPFSVSPPHPIEVGHEHSLIPAQPMTIGSRENSSYLCNLMVWHWNAHCVQMHKHFSSNPSFETVYRHVYQGLQDASSLAKQHSTLTVEELRSNIRNLKTALQEIQQSTKDWKLSGPAPGQSLHLPMANHIVEIERALKYLEFDAGVDLQASLHSK